MRFTRSYLWPALILVLSLSGSVAAQLHDRHHASAHVQDRSSQWEGSADGVAYSEFNHHLAAVFVLLIGLSELRAAFAPQSLTWTRFVSPAAMLAMGAYLVGWSDHEAWPVGTLSFSQTFLGGDLEILQHKFYAVLLLTIGTVEVLRWSGQITEPAWALPFPILAIVGGLLLFLHDHGVHPGAHSIAMNHIVMGTLAIVAGSSRLAALVSVRRNGKAGHWRWQFAWPALILLIGAQLLLYTE